MAPLLAEVKERGERAIQRDVLALEHGLSERQALALGQVLEHGSLTIQEYADLCVGVTRRSLQRDLKKLIEKGLIVEQGSNPNDPTKKYVRSVSIRL